MVDRGQGSRPYRNRQKFSFLQVGLLELLLLLSQLLLKRLYEVVQH